MQSSRLPKALRMPKFQAHFIRRCIHPTSIRTTGGVANLTRLTPCPWLLAIAAFCAVGRVEDKCIAQELREKSPLSEAQAEVPEVQSPAESPEAASQWRTKKRRGAVGSLLRWSADSSNSRIAQVDEPLISDRPDFTESSSVVGLGVLQIETGYTYSFEKSAAVQSIGHSYPEALFRMGLFAEWLELRCGAGFQELQTNGVRLAGAEDLYFGCKIGLTPQAGWRPEMAVVPQMTVPTGSSEHTSGQVLAGANWLYGWDISERLSTAGSTQFNRAIDDETAGSFTEWAQSWTVGYAWTEKIGSYTEYFGFYPTGADSVSPTHYLDGGFTFSVSNDMQLDIRGGKGLNDRADDYFVGTGLVVRFH